MTEKEKIIKHGNKVVAIVIRKEILNSGLKFYTSPSDSIQLGMHNYSNKKTGRMHGLTQVKPFKLEAIHKYIYVLKGTVLVELYDNKENIINKLILKGGDAIIIKTVIHCVKFSSNSKAIEIKQGPYQND